MIFFSNTAWPARKGCSNNGHASFSMVVEQFLFLTVSFFLDFGLQKGFAFCLPSEDGLSTIFVRYGTRLALVGESGTVYPHNVEHGHSVVAVVTIGPVFGYLYE